MTGNKRRTTSLRSGAVLGLLAAACASDETGVFDSAGAAQQADAAADSSAFPVASGGAPGAGGVGSGGVAASGAVGGSGAVAPSASGGTAGAESPPASGGAAGGGDTCDPTFCPASGTGAPCCVTATGPCGVDLGMGCVQQDMPDGG